MAKCGVDPGNGANATPNVHGWLRSAANSSGRRALLILTRFPVPQQLIEPEVGGDWVSYQRPN
jgi:hypothetical protein